MHNYKRCTIFAGFAIITVSLILVLAMGAGGCIGPPPRPTGKIEGTVSDETSGSPVVGASVFLDNRVLEPTNWAGEFTAEKLAAGQRTLSVSRYGYFPYQTTVTVQANQTTRCDVRLTPIQPGTSSIAGCATLSNAYTPSSASKSSPMPRLFAGSAAPTPDIGLPESSTDVIQVRLRPGLTASDIAGELALAGYEIVDELSLSQIVLVRRAVGSTPRPAFPAPGSADVSTERSAAALENIPGIDWAYPDYPVWAAAVPNDAFFSYQWHYNAISLPQAWDISTGRESQVTVAVLDTGIRPNHPDRIGKTVSGWDLVDRDDDPTDQPVKPKSSHGTHVAGTIAAATDNGIGVAGASWGAKIMPIRVLDGEGKGTYSAIMEGIQWAVQHGADVINMSLGGDKLPGEVFEGIVRDAYNRGVVLVAATGNNAGQVLYPAALPEVIAVGATLRNNQLAPYSNTGPEITAAAPGGLVLPFPNDGVLSTAYRYDSTASTWVNDYEFMHGTSMAAPHVSGLAALLLSKLGPMSPSAIAALISDTSMDLGADGYDYDFGAGLINAYAALTESTMDRAVFAVKDSQDQWVGESVYGRRDRTFRIVNARPGDFTLVGFLDVDGNGLIGPGDFYGEAPISVPRSGTVHADRLVLHYVDTASTAATGTAAVPLPRV